MKVLSLFTGAGGLDLGLEEAGFDIAGCVEVDLDARATIARNRPGWQLLDLPEERPGDLLGIKPKELLQRLGLKSGEISLLAGGPPCQPFSKSSFWVAGEAPRMTDPRARTLQAYLGVVDEALPEAMLLENVEGITYTPRKSTEGEALDVLATELRAINRRHGTDYRASILRLDAADYGVPQRRKRVFVFASRAGLTLDRPQPTHFKEPTGRQQRLTTAWDAIGGLDNDLDPELLPRGRWGKLLPSIPEGQNYQWHTARAGGEAMFGWRTRYWSFLLKLAKDRPSWTLQALPGPATGPFHWHSRRLSADEMTRLQTFPPDYELVGSYRSVLKQLGNAVPSAVGELLGLELRRALHGSRVRRALRLIPEQRDDCPPPEAPAAVPDEYLALRGSHAAHPGAGLGPGALERELPKAA